jgi:hypothetical protein
MIIRRKRLFWFGALLLVMGFAFLILPPYKTYCNGDSSNDYYCAAYGVTVAFGAFVDLHNGFFTALATVAVAAFTLTLWRSGEKTIRLTRMMAAIARRQMRIVGHQTDIQQKQHAIGRLQYFADHRPRLHVRHVTLANEGGPMPIEIRLSHGSEVSGALSVVNVGGSNATIVRSNYRIYFSKVGLPLRSPLDERETPLIPINTVVERGASRVQVITDTVLFDVGDDRGSRDIRQYATEGWQTYIIGEIVYQDDGGADHYMGFCRIRQSDGRFRAVDDPDYEYED